MVFGQISFFVFLAITWIVNLLLKREQRKIWLIGCSALFLGFLSISSLLIVLGTFAIVRISAVAIFRSEDALKRRLFRHLGILSILILWATCKLVPFLLSGDSSQFHYDSQLIFEGFMTLGISYYALENMGYLIDLDKKRIPHPLGFLDQLLYTLFFPKLLSGPITSLQLFNENQESNFERILMGGKRIAIGLFKKLVLADRLAPIVTHYFDMGLSEYGATNLVALFLFAFQLYFDFSAYSDCAIGLGRLFGYELPENFNQPFRSKSISEFWRRWHMSLFDWLRKYVYNPLSFRYRKTRVLGILLALWATFLLSGFWHGLGLTFVLYAIYHAFFMSLQVLWTRVRRLNKFQVTGTLHIWFTFALIALSFAFFRSSDLQQAFSILDSLHHFLPEKWTHDFLYFFSLGDSNERIFNLGITVILCLFYLLFESRIDKTFRTSEGSVFLFLVLFFLFILFGHFGSSQQFIYGQF